MIKKMKLTKKFAGEYYGQMKVDGMNIELTVSSLDGRGFSFEYTLNGCPVYSDGWYGLRLVDIKNSINSNIQSIFEDYLEK